MRLVELQVDRLVGPTHHFGGLGVGNIASQTSFGQLSYPAAAAIQGLDKMRLVAELGSLQLILPPQLRPDIAFLNAIGFQGEGTDTFQIAWDQAPELLSAAASSSAMWTANAATVTPGIDSGQSKTNITVANLNASIHRAIEPRQTESELRQLLGASCEIHRALPGGAAMRDEGAANHMRLATGTSTPGVNVFVYGDGDPMPKKNWPRQTRAACEAVARLHHLPAENTFYVKQHPAAIDAGVFHNDVVAISHQGLLIHHEGAFQIDDLEVQRMSRRYQQLADRPLNHIVVTEKMLLLTDAVGTYLFNSQIVSPEPNTAPIIICTKQVREHPGAKSLVDQWCGAGIFSGVRYLDLDQSMSGGGGPACLRLRVPVPQSDLDAFLPLAWSESLDGQLREIIRREYPDRLTLADLARDDLRKQSLHAISEIRGALLRS